MISLFSKHFQMFGNTNMTAMRTFYRGPVYDCPVFPAPYVYFGNQYSSLFIQCLVSYMKQMLGTKKDAVVVVVVVLLLTEWKLINASNANHSVVVPVAGGKGRGEGESSIWTKRLLQNHARLSTFPIFMLPLGISASACFFLPSFDLLSLHFRIREAKTL